VLLQGFRKEIFRPECNPGFQSLHCIAHLDQDITPALPFLNAVLQGDTFVNDPPSVTLKVHGKLITVEGRKIAVNALKDEQEADKILNWLLKEINQAWQNRKQIEPSYKDRERPQVFEVLKQLPHSNCAECGQPTCMVFAVRLCEGVLGPSDCPDMSADKRAALIQYLSRFHLED
jgi:ArsR family metal-binding transcriptional regulator